MGFLASGALRPAHRSVLALAALAITLAAWSAVGAARADATGAISVSRTSAPGTTTATIGGTGGGSGTVNPYALGSLSDGNHAVSVNTFSGYTTQYRYCSQAINLGDCNINNANFNGGSSVTIDVFSNHRTLIEFRYQQDTGCTSNCGGGSAPRCHGGDNNSGNVIQASVGQPRKIRGEDGTGVYSWSAPSGSLSSPSGQEVNVTYASQGSYTVTVSDPLGRTGDCRVDVTTPQAVSCGVTPNPANVNQEITVVGYNGNGTYSFSAPGGTPSSQSSGATFKTKYAAGGSKQIDVSSNGSSGSCIVSVNNPVPAARCRTISPVNSNDQPAPALNISKGGTVTVQAEDGNGSYTWSAPGGSLSSTTAKTVNVTYPNTGPYTITATDTNGSSRFPCTVNVAAPFGNLVGQWGGTGTGNSQLDDPEGIAVDSAGNVYVVEKKNNRVHKFTSNGGHLTSWGGLGTANGKFNNPIGIAIDKNSMVYVVDTGNSRVQKFDSNGVYKDKWGSAGTANGKFTYPIGIGVDSALNVYVADTENYRIQKFSSTGTFKKKWGTAGSGDNQLGGPIDIAIDTSDRLYVADLGNNRIVKYDTEGSQIGKFGTSGTADGQFRMPRHVAVDSARGLVFVADMFTTRVQVLNLNGGFVGKWDVTIPAGAIAHKGLAVRGTTVYETVYDDRVLMFN